MTAGRQLTAHQVVPIEDSWYEEKTQVPANLRAFRSFPVIAQCRACHHRIRCAAMGEPWEHAGSGDTPAGELAG